MTDWQALDATIDDFFLRSGLTSQDRVDCYTLLENLYPGRCIHPASCQGYCSMTVFVGDDIVVQFRPQSYRLDLRITSAAQRVYDGFAPETKYLTTLPSSGLLVYTMERVEGISYKEFRSSAGTYHRVRLCRDFASFLSKSWKSCNVEDIPRGRVGKSLVSRLKSLSIDLPTQFQPKARHLLKQLPHIEALPWVLTHGDIVAGNIMVKPSTGALAGLVDWAEAEYLPFGICFYGLEEILGEIAPDGFQYYLDAKNLRDTFWTELRMNIPELQDSNVFKTVKLSRDLGVLLWHGIAFDNGAIDRVVQEGQDIEEIHRLDTFLDASEQAYSDSKPRI